MSNSAESDRASGYALGHSDRELKRLTVQANLAYPISRQFFKEAGILPGMKVLDIGSGAGDVAFLAIGARKERIEGDPDMKHVSTSYAVRSNLTMRIHNRRFTRLTNAFSKKFENHVHMVAIWTVWYNWVRIHKTLRVTPAMAAGLTDRLWSWDEIVSLMDEVAPKPGRPKTYKKARSRDGAH